MLAFLLFFGIFAFVAVALRGAFAEANIERES